MAAKPLPGAMFFVWWFFAKLQLFLNPQAEPFRFADQPSHVTACSQRVGKIPFPSRICCHPLVFAEGDGAEYFKDRFKPRGPAKCPSEFGLTGMWTIRILVGVAADVYRHVFYVCRRYY